MIVKNLFDVSNINAQTRSNTTGTVKIAMYRYHNNMISNASVKRQFSTTIYDGASRTRKSRSTNRLILENAHDSNVLHPKCFLLLCVLFLISYCCTTTTFVAADKDSNWYPYGENPNTKFRMYWKDAQNVLQDLSKFRSLHIKYHGCVWSECGIDNYDDDGEGHDGDSSWYQTRTQSFCANAAYSLYGVLKHDTSESAAVHFYDSAYDVIVDAVDRYAPHCTRYSYINSFFTYSGADTLFASLGLDQVETSLFSNNNNNDKNNKNKNNNNKNNQYGYNPNSQCIEVTQENGDGKSNSGSQDSDENYEESSTMGCTDDGRFGIAIFQGSTCDGKFFLNMTEDPLDEYNDAMEDLRCVSIYDSSYYDDLMEMANNNGHRRIEEWSLSNYGSEAEMLLQHSWACDIDMYPFECPDPYGIKKKYALISKSVQQSGSQSKAFSIVSATIETPVKIASWVIVAFGVLFIIGAWHIRKKATIERNGGGFKGFFVMIWGDIKSFFVNLKDWCVKTKQKYRTALKALRASRRNRLRRTTRSGKEGKRRKSGSKSTKRSSRRKDQDDGDGDDNNTGGYMTATFSGDYQSDTAATATTLEEGDGIYNAMSDDDKKERRSSRKSRDMVVVEEELSPGSDGILKKFRKSKSSKNRDRDRSSKRGEDQAPEPDDGDEIYQVLDRPTKSWPWNKKKSNTGERHAQKKKSLIASKDSEASYDTRGVETSPDGKQTKSVNRSKNEDTPGGLFVNTMFANLQRMKELIDPEFVPEPTSPATTRSAPPTQQQQPSELQEPLDQTRSQDEAFVKSMLSEKRQIRKNLALEQRKKAVSGTTMASTTTGGTVIQNTTSLDTSIGADSTAILADLQVVQSLSSSSLNKSGNSRSKASPVPVTPKEADYTFDEMDTKPDARSKAANLIRSASPRTSMRTKRSSSRNKAPSPVPSFDRNNNGLSPVDTVPPTAVPIYQEISPSNGTNHQPTPTRVRASSRLRLKPEGYETSPYHATSPSSNINNNQAATSMVQSSASYEQSDSRGSASAPFSASGIINLVSSTFSFDNNDYPSGSVSQPSKSAEFFGDEIMGRGTDRNPQYGSDEYYQGLATVSSNGSRIQQLSGSKSDYDEGCNSNPVMQYSTGAGGSRAIPSYADSYVQQGSSGVSGTFDEPESGSAAVAPVNRRNVGTDQSVIGNGSAQGNVSRSDSGNNRSVLL